jgi:hypothetical protein
MKEDQLVIALEGVKKREVEQLMNMVLLMESVSTCHKEITCDKKIVEVNEELEIEEFEDVEPNRKITITSIKNTTKTSKLQYNMDLYLSHHNSQTKYLNEDRIRTLKKGFDTDITDMKKSQAVKPSFKVSMTCVDNKRPKVFQVNCAEIKLKTSKI